MESKKAKHLTLFIVLAVVIGAAAMLFLEAGSWLAFSEPVPPHVDIVFTFGGENVRIAYSRELMQRFPDAHWVISDFTHRYARILQREGYDMSCVTILDTCRYTISEVRGLADWLRTERDSTGSSTAKTRAALRRPLHIALVSNPFHMRRIKFIIETVFHDPAIRFHYLPVPPERYSWSSKSITRWWEFKSIRQWVGSEIAKLMIFWALFSWG